MELKEVCGRHVVGEMLTLRSVKKVVGEGVNGAKDMGVMWAG